MSNIVLIGMPGAGKTTIGRKLHKLLDRPVLDSDDQVIKETGRSVKDLFQEGEDVFRAAETAAIKTLSEMDGIIISCGGGVVKRPENIAYLQQNGKIFFLNRDLEAIAGSVDKTSRPLLNSAEDRLTQLYRERMPLYLKYSDYAIPVNEDFDQTAAQIVRLIKELGL
ncbi:shikimate kinase [Acidaminococcus sp. NSJ-142]|jgi:shikimate kinase|uniref:shikimate kinase n=1 Tax=Acidaminococcus TaxID=904 RepID=UPI000CF92DED|nr:MULTISPECIES: shikimate kinase [Acidaminococcus]MCD2435138.1 shikimate kinase [Acidaminococcus hominis]MCH4096297.1 shikimate kinase [Acidaminococcus provencensis]RHK02975.1 shikimate kinase [Acidaminococcus sp. AM05-11]